MKYILPLCCGVLFLAACVPTTTFATVRINEVAWMGTAESQYSEWVELYNDGTEDVSLAGWTLYKTADVLLFTLTKTISAGGYLLVERTTASAPDAVSGINDESGTFGGGGLRNTGEDLTLKDKDGNPIYVLPYASGWPAGDAKTKDTMQWNGSAWVTAPGTPDAANATSADSLTDSEDTPSAAPTSATASQAQTPVVAPTPIVTPPAVTKPAATVTPTTTIPAPSVTSDATTKSQADETAPSEVAPTPIVVPTTTSPTVTIKPAPQKAVTKKKAVLKTAPVINTTSNDAAANQLEANASVPKENNHTKIIIFCAVAIIGTALFLLLNRLKASQE